MIKGGGVQTPPKKQDIIGEQPLRLQATLHGNWSNDKQLGLSNLAACPQIACVDLCPGPSPQSVVSKLSLNLAAV